VHGPQDKPELLEDPTLQEEAVEDFDESSVDVLKFWDLYTPEAWTKIKKTPIPTSAIKNVNGMRGILQVPDNNFYEGVFRVVESVKKGFNEPPKPDSSCSHLLTTNMNIVSHHTFYSTKFGDRCVNPNLNRMNPPPIGSRTIIKSLLRSDFLGI